ncbi:unnamed protein product [Parnassius mnemosyne]|uniref:CUB domain-containing protein n=1 Tax=Parnassius mnemosyne TaxID=213953 RepID=A0AAV1L0E8_9NEOP
MLWTCCVCFLWSAHLVLGDGLLFLYRPRDISSECANSQHLRYDLSFGMGMSDTITLVFRTLSTFDYECEVELSTESIEEHLLVVIRFPNSIAHNCAYNRNAFTILDKSKCRRLCDMVGQQDFSSPYYTIPIRRSIHFRFISNSSVNFDMNANLYQVTATAARIAPPRGCSLRNETSCNIYSVDYCFTSGVVCDGINNCGVADWFDERKSQCNLPVEKLSYAPVVAVMAAVFCTLLVIGRGILYCLPSISDSFFIFNANEDNRLCIDTVFKSPESRRVSSDIIIRTSIIPRPRRDSERNFTMRSVTTTLGRRLKSVTGYHRKTPNAIGHVKDI